MSKCEGSIEWNALARSLHSLLITFSSSCHTINKEKQKKETGRQKSQIVIRQSEFDQSNANGLSLEC